MSDSAQDGDWMNYRLRVDWSIVIAMLLAVLFFLPPVRSSANLPFSDFAAYNRFILHIGQWGMITSPNFLYPLLVYGLHALFPSAELTGLQVDVTMLFYALLAGVLVMILKQSNDGEEGSRFMPVLLAMVLMVIAPINFVPLPKGNLYFGYVGITVYHNARMAVCRPLALLHFYLLLQFISNPKASSKWTSYFWIPTLGILVTLAKPNYALALIPAMMLWMLWKKIFSDDPVAIWKLSAIAIAPFIAVLLWQYLIMYLFPNPDIESGGVAFWPFAAYRLHSLNLIPKFLLSMVFPIAALGLFWRELSRDDRYVLLLLFFAIGLVINYCFVETGSRIGHGNFLWTGQIVMFIFFTLTTIIIRHGRGIWSQPNWKYVVVWGAFGLHVIGGVLFYYRELTAPMIYW